MRPGESVRSCARQDRPQVPFSGARVRERRAVQGRRGRARSADPRFALVWLRCSMRALLETTRFSWLRGGRLPLSTWA